MYIANISIAVFYRSHSNQWEENLEHKKQVGPRARFRLGIVGGGEGLFIGRVHARGARLSDRWEIVAGALSSRPDVARSSSLEWGLDLDRIYVDWREMAHVAWAIYTKKSLMRLRRTRRPGHRWPVLIIPASKRGRQGWHSSTRPSDRTAKAEPGCLSSIWPSVADRVYETRTKELI